MTTGTATGAAALVAAGRGSGWGGVGAAEIHILTGLA